MFDIHIWFQHITYIYKYIIYYSYINVIGRQVEFDFNMIIIRKSYIYCNYGMMEGYKEIIFIWLLCSIQTNRIIVILYLKRITIIIVIYFRSPDFDRTKQYTYNSDYRLLMSNDVYVLYLHHLNGGNQHLIQPHTYLLVINNN